MAITGKTGADAVFIALRAICGTIKRYHVKLDKVIDQAVAAEVITAEQGDAAHTFVDGAELICTIFQLVAEYSGF